MRAEKSINKEALQYIKNWKERGVFRLKFSISLDIPLVNLKEQLQAFNKTLSVIKKIQLENKGHILLQCNNIEFCKYSLKEKIELFFILKKLQTNSPFLEINFSDFIVKIDLRKNFESDFFSYEQYKECLYRERNIIQYPLDENFKDKNTIYIEHADIFTDAIAIHNPYCKKLKSNNFGSMKDSINQINTKLRAFTEEQQLLSQRYQENTDRISRCDFCIKNASQVKERILSQ